MLGNQSFITEKYRDAAEIYEEVLANNPRNYFVKKKLMICCIKTGNVHKAFEIFLNLMDENVETLLNKNSKEIRTLNYKMIYEIENYDSNLTGSKRAMALGILWFSFDTRKSGGYFNDVLSGNPNSSKLRKVINIINRFYSKK